MGLSSGALFLVITISKETNLPAYAGTAMSMANTAPFLGVSFIQPLMGYALELRWAGMMSMGAKIYSLEGYRLLFTVCIVILLFSFLSAVRINDCNRLKRE